MSENNEVSGTPEAAPALEQGQKKSTLLLAEVADLVKGSNDLVRNTVRDLLVKRKVDERVEMIDKGLKALGEAKGEMNKCKPDVNHFDDKGNKVAEVYSKEALETRKKALEKLQKVEKALELAFEGNFDKLREVAK